MDVIEVKYSCGSNYDIVAFNHAVFGRLVYRNYRGRKYATYVPGVLDNIKYFKPKNSVFYISIEDFNNINMDTINHLASITTRRVSLDIQDSDMITGFEHWAEIAREKGVFIRVQKKARW